MLADVFVPHFQNTGAALDIAEIARDANDVDCSVDDVQSTLTLAFNSLHAPPDLRVLTNRETVIQSHSRSSVVVTIDAAYMTSY